MSDMHSFTVDVAKAVGVNAAILLQSIKWWCLKNRANGKHYHDGLYWTYNSTKAWHELYPYIGKGAINSALKKLEDGGYVRTGNYNKSAYDRTKWYAITEEGLALFGESIYRNQKMDEPETENGTGETEKPIPDTLPVTYPTTKPMGEHEKRQRFTPPTREQVREYVAQKGYHFDPDQFYDYYDASDWHLQGGKRITRWKQCCVTWENNHRYDRPRARQTTLDSYDDPNAKVFDASVWEGNDVRF